MHPTFGFVFNRPAALALGTVCALSPWAPVAHAHEGGGDGEHLNIGFYYGHDGSFESPANPAEPATLLVDTHPWELGNVYYNMLPGEGLFNGWVTEFPGYRPLPTSEEELGGHGYYSWLNAERGIDAPDLVLDILSIDEGLAMYDPATYTPVEGSMALGVNAGNHHMLYFVDANSGLVEGDVLEATFQLRDLNGNLATSQPYTLQFRLVPEPAMLAPLLGLLPLATRRRRRHTGR